MKITAAAAAAAVALALSGCAVNRGSTNARAVDLKKTMEEIRAEGQREYVASSSNPAYKRIGQTYIGTRSAPMALNAVLPPAVNEMTFQLPKRTNLDSVGKIISSMTKYPFRINPDVFVSANAIVPQIEKQDSSHQVSDMPSNAGSVALRDMDTSLPTNFDGKLKEYLDTICAVLNVNWEFDPVKGFYVYRLVTKVFEVKLHAGDVGFGNNVAKGSVASTGGTGTGTASSTGSYNAQTTSRSNAYYSPWQSLNAQLDAIKSPLGKVALDISSNSVLIKDVRDVVDQAELIVKRNNEVHNRSITLEMRVMRVAYNDTTASNFGIESTYRKLLASGGAESQFTLKSPGSLAGTDAGGLGINVVSPLSRWTGTDVLIQAVSQLGTIVSDETRSLPTMNRRTVPIAQFDTDTYLAETTPAAGGALGNAAGVPGLKPATITTGTSIQMTPTAFDDGSVWIDLSIDQSAKRGAFGTASTGAGETFQQIQLPNTQSDSKQHSVAIKQGERLMLVSVNRDTTSHTQKGGLTGASSAGERQREMQIIILTPYVRSM